MKKEVQKIKREESGKEKCPHCGNLLEGGYGSSPGSSPSGDLPTPKDTGTRFCGACKKTFQLID